MSVFVLLVMVCTVAPVDPIAAQGTGGETHLPLVGGDTAPLEPVPAPDPNLDNEDDPDGNDDAGTQPQDGPVNPPGTGDDDSDGSAPAAVTPPLERSEAEEAAALEEEAEPEAEAEPELFGADEVAEPEVPAVYDVLGPWRVRGRLGVGTQNPLHKVHVVANAAGAGGAYLANLSASQLAFSHIQLNTTGASAALEIRKYGPNSAHTWDGINLSDFARIRTQPEARGLIIATGGLEPLILGTNNRSRVRITSGGRVAINTTLPIAKLHVEAGTTSGVHSASTGSFAMQASNTNTAGASDGLRADTAASAGYAVWARAFHATGGTVAVYADNDSTSGTAVLAIADASTGTTYAVYADNDSDSGRAVYALADASTGLTYGVYAENDSTNGTAVIGIADAASGDTEGVIGISSSPTGEGVEAVNNSASADANILAACSTGATGCGTFQWRVQRDGDVITAGAFTSGGADYADMLAVAEPAYTYEPGDVLVLADDAQLTLTDEPNSTAVIGVYSSDPAMVGDPLANWSQPGLSRAERTMMETLTKDRVPVAMAGIVPVNVTAENGPILPGDLLTSSSTPGHAMKALPLSVDGVDIYRQGTIIGKAMTALDEEEGVVEMLVMMQ